jgi:hypothetical protein
LLFFGVVLLLSGWAGPGNTFAQPICPPQKIIIQPVSLIVLTGNTAIFTVGAETSTCQTNYTWHYFGVNVLGGTNPVLTISNVQPNNVGLFSVSVTNVSGGEISSNVTLTVVSGVDPPYQTVRSGSDVTFRPVISAVPGTPATNLTYRWRFNAQDLPGATNFALMLTNVQPSNAGPYSVVVSNPAGSVTTPEATLDVQAMGPTLWGEGWTSNGFHFQVTGSASTSYRVQTSRDCRSWTDLSTNFTPASGTFDVFDPAVSGLNWRCYRAVHP